MTISLHDGLRGVTHNTCRPTNIINPKIDIAQRNAMFLSPGATYLQYITRTSDQASWISDTHTGFSRACPPPILERYDVKTRFMPIQVITRVCMSTGCNPVPVVSTLLNELKSTSYKWDWYRTLLLRTLGSTVFRLISHIRVDGVNQSGYVYIHS